MADLTFQKKERLKSRKLIDALFRSRRSVGAYPVRAVFMPLDFQPEGEPRAQISISVPKKTFKKAHDRNRIRRQIRECWRLQKGDFYEKLPAETPCVAVMILFVGKEAAAFEELRKGVRKMCSRLLDALADEPKK